MTWRIVSVVCALLTAAPLTGCLEDDDSYEPTQEEIAPPGIDPSAPVSNPLNTSVPSPGDETSIPESVESPFAVPTVPSDPVIAN